MTFCQHFFGKEIEQVTFQDVSDLILGRSDLESTYLECKSCETSEVKSKNCAPAIVGFLNIGGGLLIIGTPREAGNPRRFQSDFTFHSYIEKDHLRDRLIGSIQPLPTGIRIESKKKDDNHDQYVTLVDVQRSEYPPHQYQGKYYVRLDGSNKPAPHSLVEAMFNGRRPRHQQALIEHFNKKIVNLRRNEVAMKALYYLVLENRPVEEPVILASVFRDDQIDTSHAGQLVATLQKIVTQLGILTVETVMEKKIFFGKTYSNYRRYSINPDYQGLLADVVFEMNRQNEFHLSLLVSL